MQGALLLKDIALNTVLLLHDIAFKCSIISIKQPANNFIEHFEHVIQVTLTSLYNSCPSSWPHAAHTKRPHMAVTTCPSHYNNVRLT